MRILFILSAIVPLLLSVQSQDADNQYILTFFGSRRPFPHRHGPPDGHHHHHRGPPPPPPPSESASADQAATNGPSEAVTVTVPQPPPPPPPHHMHGPPRPLLGKMSFSVMLKDGKRLDDVGGSQRVEPMGRLSEYVISLPSTVSLDEVASVIIRFRTNNTRRYRAVRMAKIWITSVKPELKRAQFNVPDEARNELVPDSEFVMHRGCKMFNKEADKLLISMYAGTGFLCQDVKIENAVHEDEQADWQQFFKAPTPVVAA